MKKKLKIIIPIAVIMIIIISVALFVILFNKNKEDINKKINDQLMIDAVTYYEESFSKLMPTYLYTNGMITITLETLKISGTDLSLYEEYECDLQNTNAVLTYIKDLTDPTNEYTVDINLSCKKLK